MMRVVFDWYQINAFASFWLTPFCTMIVVSPSNTEKTGTPFLTSVLFSNHRPESAPRWRVCLPVLFRDSSANKGSA
jgi:hypothetical protein